MRLTRTVLSVVLGLTTACMAAGTCRLAHAQATRLVSAFTAPESCPNAREFQQAVERLLGGELPQQIPSIDVRAVRVGDGYSVHSTARFADGTGGEREFRDPECGVAFEAAALVAALMIDADAVAETQAAQPPDAGSPNSTEVATAENLAVASSVSPTADPDASAALTVASASAGGIQGDSATASRADLDDREDPLDPPTATRVSWARWMVGLGVAGDLGTLPRAAVGPFVRFGLLIQPMSLQIEGRFLYLPPVGEELTSHPTAAGDLSLLVGGLDLLYRIIRTNLWSLGAGAGLEIGGMRGEGTGVTNPGEGWSTWWMLHFVASVGLHFDPFSVRLDAGLGVPLSRAAFVLENVGQVHRASPVAGRVAISVQFQF